MPEQISEDMNTSISNSCSMLRFAEEHEEEEASLSLATPSTRTPNSSGASPERKGNDDGYYYHPLPCSTSNTSNTSSAFSTNPNTTSTAYLYHDYSMVNYTEKHLVTKGGVKAPFPVKLFYMLEHIDLHEPELSSIISWQPHGRCFITHNPLKMEELILPRFFKQKQYASFRRQLNLWGFSRISQKGTDGGAYYHELFLRSKPYLCRDMKRGLIQRSLVEGTTSTTITINPKTEPMFNSMPALPPSSSSEEGRNTVVAAATGTTTTARSGSTGATMSPTMSHPEMMVRSSRSPSFLSPLTTEAAGSTSSERKTIYLRTGGEEVTQQEYSSSLSSSSRTAAKEYDESPLSCEVAPMSAHPVNSPSSSSNAIINSCQLPPHYWNADDANQIPFLSGDYSNSDLTPFTGNAPPLTAEEKEDIFEFLLKIGE